MASTLPSLLKVRQHRRDSSCHPLVLVISFRTISYLLRRNLGCHYRWYSTAEICMILDRFDGIVFIGDTMPQHIYTAFNILLRQNMALGGLQQWKMSESERGACRCENQFIKNECSKFAVTTSEEVKKNDGGSGHSSPYYCDRQFPAKLPTPHMLIITRHSSHLSPRDRVSRAGRCAFQLQLTTRPGPELLQASASCTFSLSEHFTLLANSDCLHGRVAQASRCFSSEHPFPLVGPGGGGAPETTWTNIESGK